MGFQRESTKLQLARLIGNVKRNFDERRPTDAVSLHVANASDTLWNNGLLYKLTVLNFPSHLVKTTSYLEHRMFQTYFQSATSTCRRMRATVGQSGVVSVLFSLTVNDIATPSCNVELVQQADNTALVATLVIWRPQCTDALARE